MNVNCFGHKHIMLSKLSKSIPNYLHELQINPEMVGNI